MTSSPAPAPQPPPGPATRPASESSSRAWRVCLLALCLCCAGLRLWSLASGECVKTFEGHQGAVLQVQFSSDNRSLISAGIDRLVKIWDIQSGECLQTLTGHSGLIYAMDVATSLASPQKYAYTGSLDETIKMWDLTTVQCLATWKIRRPYEDMKIDKIQGLTDAQKSTLKALGAVITKKAP